MIQMITVCSYFLIVLDMDKVAPRPGLKFWIIIPLSFLYGTADKYKCIEVNGTRIDYQRRIEVPKAGGGRKISIAHSFACEDILTLCSII
jgi:hypothetical protein